MDIRDRVPVIRVAIRGANGRMGLQAIYASMENNEDILARAKTKELTDKDVWIDVVFGAFTADIPTVQQLMAGVMRSEKAKILEGYDKKGSPIYRVKSDGKFELRTRYVEQTLDEEPQRRHVIPFDRQELVDSPEGLPAIKILSRDKQEVLSVIRHANVRLGELSAEAIMDRVLDTANDLGAHVLLSCVGDTAKKADRMQMWLDKIHEKNYAIGFLESAPAKGWDKRILSRQDQISVLCSRNFSPTGTLFRTGIALKQPLFDYNPYEFGKAAERFKKIFTRIVENVIATDMFKDFAQILKKTPTTIREIDGEEILVNFPPDFLTITSPSYLVFSFYEDNEYGFICAALIPNLKALGLIYRDAALVEKIRKNGHRYEAVTNIPGLFGTDWMVKAPAEIIARGGAMCTTNGNIVGDTIVMLALHCYYDFFAEAAKDYFTASDSTARSKAEEKIEKRFSDFKGYLSKLLAKRSTMIKTVFTFYYDQVAFMNTDMQHGLTRSESPEVLAFLRETSSGSQTEVPRLLSLPAREKEYLTAQKAVMEKQASREKDEQEKARLLDEMKRIDASLKSLDTSIDIVDIIEKTEGK